MNRTAGVTVSTCVLALLVAACAPVSETCRSEASVVGNWRYSAIEQAPVRATLTGTLSVTQQSCGNFSGTLNVVEVTAQGGSRQLSGPINGQVVDAGSLQFDAFLEADARQHLASIAGDSLTGTWILVDPTGTSPSGTFGSHRSATQ